MNLAAQDQLATELRHANDRLRRWLQNLAPETNARPASPLQINALLGELLKAGERLRAGFPSAPDPELDSEICDYRRNLEQLRDLMPFIQTQLLKERARLEQERTRLESAGQWAQGSQQTL